MTVTVLIGSIKGHPVDVNCCDPVRKSSLIHLLTYIIRSATDMLTLDNMNGQYSVEMTPILKCK